MLRSRRILIIVSATVAVFAAVVIGCATGSFSELGAQISSSGALSTVVTQDDGSTEATADASGDSSATVTSDETASTVSTSDASSASATTQSDSAENTATTNDTTASSSGDATLSVSSDPGSTSSTTTDASGSEPAASSSSSSSTSEDTGTATTITVHVEVECSNAVAAGYGGSDGNATMYSGDVTVDEGASVYKALKATGLKVSGDSSYVSAISGLAERQYGSGSGWVYYINGSYGTTGCGSASLSAGDEVCWRYTCTKGDVPS
jgi:hypothetical protein